MGISGALFLAMVLLTAVETETEEVVRLRSGKWVCGTFLRNKSSTDGFYFRLLEGGAVFIRWNQLPSSEVDRLLRRAAGSPDPSADIIDGIRVVTPSRVVEGVLVREEADRIFVKTWSSPSPVAVPKVAIVHRLDHVNLPESEAYDAQDRLKRRLARVGPGDLDGIVKAADLASRWGLPGEAKELYLRVATMDPSRTDEMDDRIHASVALAREHQAAALLGDIGRSSRQGKFQVALDFARKLSSEWPDTEVARANKDLVANLEEEVWKWRVNKGEMLTHMVPEMYRENLFKRVGQAAKLSMFSQARSAVGQFESEILKLLGEELGSTPEEIRTALTRGERRVRTVGFGTGSWIILGTTEGGLDSDAKFIPVRRNLAKPPPEPIDLGLNLDTAQDWWAKAGSFERRDWLEAEYARSSAVSRRNSRERHCSRCLGEGTLPVSRMGIDFRAKCPRCHGTKVDVVIEYQ